MADSVHIREHDAALHICYGDPRDAAIEAMHVRVIRHLRARGFVIHPDRDVPKLIRNGHHIGGKGDLRVYLECWGRRISIEFYQELVTQNANGGRYDFDKRQKMPYLIGKQYELERTKLAAALGLSLELETRGRGMPFIEKSRRDLCAFQGRDMYARIKDYNARCADGTLLQDGDTVYWRDERDGRLRRGQAWHNINNMWWVLLPCGDVRNVPAFLLAHRDHIELKPGRWFPSERRVKRLHALKQSAVEAENYERAAELRDVLRVAA